MVEEVNVTIAADPSAVAAAGENAAKDVIADTVTLEQGSAENVKAETVTVNQGSIAHAEGTCIDVKEGAIALAQGANITVNSGAVAAALAENMKVQDSLVVFALAGEEIQGEDTLVLFDLRAAVLFGVIFGAVAGLMRMFFKRRAA